MCIRDSAKGEGLTFYGPEEALIAYNEGKCDIHAPVSVIVKDVDEKDVYKRQILASSSSAVR